ncbi:glycerophosphodiester phosphodiesterase family protein [Aciduricibacillus chroicocephali]|uniref:Glycerophosphodiester phosphodiesterase family protein n=1 Tax=Aciduricibacillus chroicocephali TaxID=3054939 RepID=A0ABY9KRX5_9BACI|nr:glycerophosphodiester phosphodiesterase family protein [Bacillaceae bacterium 44XB]
MRPSIIAHRGASNFAPENTLPAFQLAWEMGADAIETDLHLTKDGIPVLIHDETVNRTTNGRGYVQDFTLAELQMLDAGAKFSAAYSGTGILDLATFLQWAKPKPLKLNLELKNNKIDYPHLEEIAYEYVSAAGMLDRIIFSTFNLDSVKRLGRYREKTEIAMLASRKALDVYALAKELQVHAVHIKHTLMKPALISACHKEKIAVRVFTVNTEAMMLQAFNHHCDVITDKPGTAVRCLGTYIK